MTLHAGMVFVDRYKLLRSVGKGGMASIYLATDQRLERSVAIKILNPSYSENSDFRTRFAQEAKAAANLIHPNLVAVYDFGEDGENVFIVMEYVPGTDLKKFLEEKQNLDVHTSLALMVQACAGVGYAHRAGLIHCDLKPQNLLITPDFQLKVTDFGISRALSSIHPDEKNEIVWGSPYYLSPEQAAGNPPSPASDVYSLGIVLFEMLTGKLPFRASTSEQMVELQINAVPPDPSSINSAIPQEIDILMQKVLAKEPSARYRTADQFGRVISHLSQNLFAAGSNLSLTIPDFTSDNQDGLEEETQKIIPRVVGNNTPSSFIGLLLLALFMVGGLIPFWLFVILSLRTGY